MSNTCKKKKFNISKKKKLKKNTNKYSVKRKHNIKKKTNKKRLLRGGKFTHKNKRVRNKKNTRKKNKQIISGGFRRSRKREEEEYYSVGPYGITISVFDILENTNEEIYERYMIYDKRYTLDNRKLNNRELKKNEIYNKFKEIFKASDLMVDSLTQLISKKRQKQQQNQ